MKKILRKLAAAAMAFTLLGTGTAASGSRFTVKAQAPCQYHRTDNVTWRDGNPYCKCCGQINYDACCKHNGQRYAGYDNDWVYKDYVITYVTRYCTSGVFVYRRDEHIKCSKCGKNIGKTGHYQEKIVNPYIYNYEIINTY